jgi:hypothetical protein
MIQVTSYSKSDKEIIDMLHISNNVENFDISENLPEIGFIATEGAIPVAAGFLRRIEGGYAQIDSLVSNKDMPGPMRHEALDKIVQTLITTAKTLKIKGIISYTQDKSVVMRAVATGFEVTQNVVISLKLQE